MARKPLDNARKTASVGTPSAKSAAASPRQTDGDGSLRRELAATRTRIAALEKNQRELAKRIEAAIAAIQKLLEI